MPFYISISPTINAADLANSLRYSVCKDLEGEWIVNEQGDFQKKLETADARTGQAFRPVIDRQKLKLVFTNHGVYEPSDYADYYTHFVGLLIKEHRTKFSMIRIMFDEPDIEVDIHRETIEDYSLVGLPAKDIKSALKDSTIDANARIERALSLIEKLGY